MGDSVTWLICLVNHPITGYLMFVLASVEWSRMCPTINNSTSYEIHALIRFLHARNMSAAEIHRELCLAYGWNVMSEETARQWCRMFRNEQKKFYSEERNGQPGICSKRKIYESWCFRISKFLCKFPQISCTIPYEIITDRLSYHKFRAIWVPKILSCVP